MKHVPVALLVSVAVAPAAHAVSFAERCPDVATCARVVADLLNQKYLFDADLKGTPGKTLATSNLELTSSNAELLFTTMLHQNGLTRVPLGEAGTFQILRQRDARDSVLPVLEATQERAPRFPAHWDMVTLKYKATHPEVVEQIALTTRVFMPANARIVPSELSGMLLVTASAMDAKKVYDLIRENDRKPTPEMKKRWAQSRAETAARATAPDPAPMASPRQN